MVRTGCAVRTLVVMMLLMSAFTPAAQAQNFYNKIPQSSSPPVENRPKVDEKAYKAALDRIPAPKQPYDPWGNARPSETAKRAKTSNQD